MFKRLTLVLVLTLALVLGFAPYRQAVFSSALTDAEIAEFLQAATIAVVGEVPPDMRSDYESFADNCSKCHGLERALAAPAGQLAVHVDDAPRIRHIVRRVLDADLLDTVEVLLPAPVMVAGLHLVDPRLAVVDGRDAVLDPGREHEVGDGSFSSA